MNTANLKKEIADKISKIDDENVLLSLDVIINELVNGRKDFYDELPEKIKNDIEEAQQEIDKGKGIPHNEVMNEIKARYKKS
jgi:hypothetical protein